MSFPDFPDATGQEADAVSAYAQVKMEDDANVIGITRFRMSYDLGPSAENPPPKAIGQSSRSSLKEICADTP